MYGYGYSYGYGLIGGNTYNPYINYDWSTTTTSGLRYLKDVGSTPTYNASMYFGRGAYLNGVDQTITVPINTTIQTALKRVNGVVTINETSQTLTNYVISGLGVHKDYYLFTRLLTTAEKDSYTNTPELFYAMAQADNTCVLNMPMCETDGYVRNMKSYSLGTNLASINLSGTITGAGNTIVQDVNVFNISSVTATLVTYHPLIVFSPNTFTSDLYNIEVEVKCTSGTLKVARLECTSPLVPNDILTAGTTKTYSLVAGFEDIVGRKGNIYLDGLNYPIYTAVVTVKKVEKITAGIYPITNYTTSVRDNAKNLQYGLQTCKFVRDSLGVIQSASDYLVLDKTADGYGYINNLSIPSNLTMEIVFDQSNSNYANYNKLLDWETNFKIERLGTSNIIYGIIGTTNIGSLSVSSANTAFIVYVLNFTTSTVLRYLNSVFIGENPMPASTLFSAKKLYLGNNSSLNRGIGGVIKLFKVHNKALTKEEITKNYNEYVAKGLLS